MDLQLQGRRAVITGGSRGIGLAAARALVAEGAAVTLVGRDAATVQAAVRELAARPGAEVDGLALDLALAEHRAQLAGTAAAADVLVNNAGAIPGGGLDAVDDARWRAAWELKVHGFIDLTRAVLPAMLARGRGVIVNVIGIAGAQPRWDYLCGSVANAALIAFTRAVGGHASRHGVRVLGLNPGPTRTDRLLALYRARAQERFGDAERWRETLQHLPFGRPAEPQEMGDLVAFLASARASYLSGVVIDADGGARHVDR